MTFTQEYERMRPLDEDHGDIALEFTCARERPFDVEMWFIETFLPFRTIETWSDKIVPLFKKPKPKPEEPFWGWPEPRRVSCEELGFPELTKEEEEDYFSKLSQEAAAIYKRLTCFCGARGEYYIDGVPLCINHVHSWNPPRVWVK